MQGKGVTTDFEGKYSFYNIPEGEYTIKVSYMGYGIEAKNITITGKESVVVDFALSPSAEKLQAVEITGRKATSYKNDLSYAAAKTATAIKDIPQAVSYVIKELIADQQAYRVNKIAEKLA